VELKRYETTFSEYWNIGIDYCIASGSSHVLFPLSCGYEHGYTWLAPAGLGPGDFIDSDTWKHCVLDNGKEAGEAATIVIISAQR